ncbi:toxin TcdB middle/N-terminal domain-containing protein, partial [Pseudomonas viridiflava]|uniref:toxin TcdB middle/N-terminal domain-containing protein n=1 Tax=Pseudomonas viridiflava TaxID=33069 RepID=UPI0013CECCC8
MLVLSRVDQHDEFSNHTLTQRHLYRRGYWDPVEREFRGFAYCESCETDNVPGELAAVPLRACRWYHTGRAEDGRQLFGAPFKDTGALA